MKIIIDKGHFAVRKNGSLVQSPIVHYLIAHIIRIHRRRRRRQFCHVARIFIPTIPITQIVIEEIPTQYSIPRVISRIICTFESCKFFGKKIFLRPN